MTVQIDTERAAAVAATLERQQSTMRGFADELRRLGWRMNLVGETQRPATISDEAAGELGETATVLHRRIELAGFADEHRIGYERAEADYTAAVRALRASLDDGVGGIGDGSDDARLLAQDILGGDLPDPTRPETVQRVLDTATPAQAARFWLMLDEVSQDAAIDGATAAVSDRYIAGVIDLDAAQVVALQLQPVPSTGRQPSSGNGSDWAGVEIPVPDDASGVSVWAYDAQPRAFADGWICSLVQFGSPIPSPISTSGASGVIDAASTANQIRTLATEGSILIPSSTARSVPVVSIVAGLADLGLCRLGVGSGYPISTATIIDEGGQPVYEGSRSTQKYMDDNGLPLSPNPRERDRQMWNAEHANESGLVLEPYPGFPAYEVNAVGYAVGEG